MPKKIHAVLAGFMVIAFTGGASAVEIVENSEESITFTLSFQNPAIDFEMIGLQGWSVPRISGLGIMTAPGE